MLPEMFFNELSLGSHAVDTRTAQEQVEQFVLLIRHCASQGVQSNLHVPMDFYAYHLASNYCLNDWLHDGRVDRDHQRYFLTVTTSIPFLRDESSLSSAWASIDCLLSAKRALGLGAAYIADGLAISMATDSRWDCDSIQVEIQEIVEDDVSSSIEAVHHASSTTHVTSQLDWILCRLKSAISSGQELWERVGEFFPCLAFCREVETQMRGLPTEALPGIFRGLFRLNSYCTMWNAGSFSPDSISCDVSPDSEPTMRSFGAERTFTRPGGEKYTFRWHAKCGHWRIYFDQNSGPGQLLIGYAGRHLRTVLFR